MKTFETEKHNIPDGATHYSDSSDERYFSWFMHTGDEWFIQIWSDKDWVKCKHNEQDKSGVKPIPQTNIETPEEKEVEWVNGDECISSTGYKFTFIGLCNYSSFDCILMSDKGVPTFGFTKELSKPETPQQREEREAVENLRDAIQQCEDLGLRAYHAEKLVTGAMLNDGVINLS